MADASTSASPYVKLTLPPEYVWVLCSVLLTVLVLLGMTVPAFRARMRNFTTQFMTENFGKMHFEELEKAGLPETPISDVGHPDHGNGRYSEKLSYA
jgi:hypothetical protein